jgi:hypothetical protein
VASLLILLRLGRLWILLRLLRWIRLLWVCLLILLLVLLLWILLLWACLLILPLLGLLPWTRQP